MDSRSRHGQPDRPVGGARWARPPARIALACLSLLSCLAGCGTTRWSDTSRTATEQMLLSDAIDRAVSQVDFSMLAGYSVFLDNKFIAGEVDEHYIISTLRQHMMASGCMIKERAEDATCVIEIRSGAVGTNRSDLLFGVPATSLPTGGALTGIPSTIPEIPLVKRTAQQGVCKIAVFAYDRASGRPFWQSGTRQVASQTKDVWIFGAGPFTRGTIHDGTHLAGEQLAKKKRKQDKNDSVWVAHEIVFPDPSKSAQVLAGGATSGVSQAAMNVPIGGPPGNAAGTAAGVGAGFGGAPAAPHTGETNPSRSGSSSSNSNSSSGNSNNSSSSSTGGGSSTSSSVSSSGSGSSTTSSANPVSGAVGAVDWAHTMFDGNRASASSAAGQTPTTPAATAQTPGVLRLRGL